MKEKNLTERVDQMIVDIRELVNEAYDRGYRDGCLAQTTIMIYGNSNRAKIRRTEDAGD